jgi:NitT/TauT family transport system permease protein
MPRPERIFRTGLPVGRGFNWGDGVVLLFIAALLYLGVHLAADAPQYTHGPTLTLSPLALPVYAALSLQRVIGAYILSLLFTLFYGYAAARNKRAERVLLPLLDVLQSVPILSFLPVVLLALAAVLPERIAAELAAVVLIFTSQAWNMTFSWYQSLTTVPGELQEASRIFRFSGWQRFRSLELPFAALGLIWNSVMSFAGGWFFLMAAEMFSVGGRDFRLPGLGSYLQLAASKGDLHAVAWGVGTLIVIIVLLDQLLWRPLLAWAERFKVELVGGEEPQHSWFFDVLSDSKLARWFFYTALAGVTNMVDDWIARRSRPSNGDTTPAPLRPWMRYAGVTVIVALLAYPLARAGHLLITTPAVEWGQIGLGLGATLLRVAIALLIALAWTIPVGVLIGVSPKAAAWLQPLVQIAASVPATALFPVLLLFILKLPGGINVAAVLLMLMGTQWYLLFNVIAGASAIPQDLKYTASLIGLSRADRWRTLLLPSLFPYIITGAITASGGAWNASIVAEYTVFGNQTVQTTGVGALISRATAAGNYPLLLAATLSMVVTVVMINRFVWRRLYRVAESRFKVE